MSTLVAGVDGCRGGWICVLKNVEKPFCERAFVARTFDEVLKRLDDQTIIAVDIPIGLAEVTDGAGRECDAQARGLLGKRCRAVFPVPARAALAETDYRRACAVALASSNPPRRISKQMFHLFPKVREVDAVMTPRLQSRVFECHPELCFWAMNGRVPLAEPKKIRGRPHIAGLDYRRSRLLRQGFSEHFLNPGKFAEGNAGQDDFLDACACAWTAARIHRREAIGFPQYPPIDAKGLRMEILA